MPFFVETDDEQLAVQKKLEPRLEQALQAKGFHLVAWGTGGWVQLFSKKPLRSLADVKAAKLYTSKSDDRMVQWYTRNGFNPVPLSHRRHRAAAEAADGDDRHGAEHGRTSR